VKISLEIILILLLLSGVVPLKALNEKLFANAANFRQNLANRRNFKLTT
jgi:hypothetical protein